MRRNKVHQTEIQNPDPWKRGNIPNCPQGTVRFDQNMERNLSFDAEPAPCV